MNKVVQAGIAAALWLATTVHAVERVSALHSDIRVASSGELAVTETLEVQTLAREAQRGLVRDFAAHYRDRLGNRARVPLAVDKVLRNGRPEPYTLERVAGGMRLRTGAAGSALPRGKHVYQIAYRTARQVSFFEQHDELYWNVGEGWGFAFERLSAEVSFEAAVPAEAIKLDAHTGAPDARGEDFHAFVRAGSAAFRATRPLAAREGMSIVVAFPKGVVAQPSLLARAAAYFSAQRGVPVGAGMLALMLAFLLVCRRRFAAQPLPAPRAVLPEGVGPGGVRFIQRRGYDERCLGAALLGLQSRGYLRIREHGERFRLERTGREVEWFPGEEALARRLLRDERAEMRRHGRAMEEAGRKFAQELRRAFGARCWSREGSFVLAAAGIGAVGVLAMLALETPVPALAVLSALFVLTLMVFALKLLPLYCMRGREHQDEIDALGRYLAAAEPQSAEEFVRLLPYAVALDLEAAWGKRFASLRPALVELTAPSSAPASDKAPAPPRRPLRHTRSAAA